MQSLQTPVNISSQVLGHPQVTRRISSTGGSMSGRS